MSSVLERLLVRRGLEPTEFRPNSNLGRLLRRDGVPWSAEVRRVVALPRRSSFEGGEDRVETGGAFADDLTEYLKQPGGTMRLRPVQAAALRELHDRRGLFAPVRVGAGKTIVSLLAATVVEAVRPLLLVPAKLRDKTRRDLDVLRVHWRIHPGIRVESYEMLGRVSGATILDDYAPDLVVADECAKLKNSRAAVTRRVARYLEAHSQTVFAGMSGTVCKRSLLDYAHLVRWALRDGAPVPSAWHEARAWADALDDDVDFTRVLRPGALAALMDEREARDADEGAEEARRAARSAYRRRLVETEGVVATAERHLGCSLSIEVVDPYESGNVADIGLARVEREFASMRETWTTPDGWPIADPVALWRHARELACGLYYRWNPRPPEYWLRARAAWAKFVREEIARRGSRLDSELQVARARADHPTHLDWARVRPSYEPQVEAVWIDDTVLHFATRWMQEHAGVVWVEHVAFGRRLSEVSGVPYYGAGGVDADGQAIEDAPLGRPVVASVASNAEGRNLQAWSEALVVSASPTGIVWEQVLGRLHREGQQADEVVYTVLAGCAEQWNGLGRARRDARYLEESLGQAQKLCYADWVVPNLARRGVRWAGAEEWD